MWKTLLLVALLFGCSTTAYSPGSLHVKFSYTSTQGYSDHDRAKLSTALKLLSWTVNSSQFQENFLAAHFTETGGLSNRQILDKFAAGLSKINPNSYELRFIKFNENSDIIGFVLFPLPSNKIFQNEKYFTRSAIAVAENVIHEAMHLIGFDHVNTKRMYTSVPYLAGDIFIQTLLELDPKDFGASLDSAAVSWIEMKARQQ